MSTSNSTAFDDVKALNLSAKDLLAKYGRQAVEARKTEFSDPEVKGRVSELTDLIERDIRDLDLQVKSVEKIHASWPSVPKRGSHYTKALQVGGQYVEIVENTNSTVGVAAFELVELMNNRNIAATEQSANQQPSI
jgi:hypothetical protein